MIGNTAVLGSLGSWLSDLAKKPIAPLALLWPLINPTVMVGNWPAKGVVLGAKPGQDGSSNRIHSSVLVSRPRRFGLSSRRSDPGLAGPLPLAVHRAQLAVGQH
jgi:hypothetical protein